jgi:hypothetical protein
MKMPVKACKMHQCNAKIAALQRPGELRAWPVLKPHRSDLIASLLLMAGVLGGMKDESGYKSFFEEAEHE